IAKWLGGQDSNPKMARCVNLSQEFGAFAAASHEGCWVLTKVRLREITDPGRDLPPNLRYPPRLSPPGSRNNPKYAGSSEADRRRSRRTNLNPRSYELVTSPHRAPGAPIECSMQELG